VLHLIPVAGSVTAGVITSLIGNTASPTVGWTVLAFFLAYRFLEDYLIFPGIVGVLLAFPVAAAVHLLLHEIAFPRLDNVEPAAS